MNVTHNPGDPWCDCFLCLTDLAESGLLAPVVIPMEDELVHTDEHPVCSDLECPCHAEQESGAV